MTLDELAALPADWDGLGAEPVAPKAIAGARDLLAAMALLGFPEPTRIIPGIDGGHLHLEWQSELAYLDFEVGESGLAEVFWSRKS